MQRTTSTRIGLASLKQEEAHPEAKYSELLKRAMHIKDGVIAVIAVVKQAIEYDIPEETEVKIVKACQATAKVCVEFKKLSEEPEVKLETLHSKATDIQKHTLEMLKTLNFGLEEDFIIEIERTSKALFQLIDDYFSYLYEIDTLLFQKQQNVDPTIETEKKKLEDALRKMEEERKQLEEEKQRIELEKKLLEEKKLEEQRLYEEMLRKADEERKRAEEILRKIEEEKQAKLKQDEEERLRVEQEKLRVEEEKRLIEEAKKMFDEEKQRIESENQKIREKEQQRNEQNKQNSQQNKQSSQSKQAVSVNEVKEQPSNAPKYKSSEPTAIPQKPRPEEDVVSSSGKKWNSFLQPSSPRNSTWTAAKKTRASGSHQSVKIGEDKVMLSSSPPRTTTIVMGSSPTRHNPLLSASPPKIQTSSNHTTSPSKSNTASSVQQQKSPPSPEKPVSAAPVRLSDVQGRPAATLSLPDDIGFGVKIPSSDNNKAKPQSKPDQLELYDETQNFDLEDFNMKLKREARACSIEIRNHTKETMVLESKQLDNCEWILIPPTKIPPQKRVYFGCASKTIATNMRGTVVFKAAGIEEHLQDDADVPAERGDKIEFFWEAPRGAFRTEKANCVFEYPFRVLRDSKLEKHSEIVFSLHLDDTPRNRSNTFGFGVL